MQSRGLIEAARVSKSLRAKQEPTTETPSISTQKGKKEPTIQVSEIISNDGYDITGKEPPDKYNELTFYSSRKFTLPKYKTAEVNITSWILVDDELDDWYKVVQVVGRDSKGVIGKMSGEWIDRRSMRSISTTLSVTTPETPINHCAAFQDSCCQDILDLSANLKSDLLPGSKNSGKGSWGKEMNEGCLFLVNWVYILPAWRGKGLGDLMFKTLLRKAQTINKGYKFAIVVPGTIVEEPGFGRESKGTNDMGNGDKERRRVKVSDETEEGGGLRRAIMFYSKHGFKRIGNTGVLGRATDVNHPTRRVEANQEKVDVYTDEMLLLDSPADEVEQSLLDDEGVGSRGGGLEGKLGTNITF